MVGTPGGNPWPSEAWPGSQPPPYSYTDEFSPKPLAKQPTWLCADPRESSSQSLSPSSFGDPEWDGGRRRLLVIYIHGFYGNDQSFRSFPAHIHGYLKEALLDTHAVHSKIYPRYKTYKAIDIAVENFSAWLKPHENPETDVVLVGHSMGGILAAEVALLQNRHPYSHHPLRHRIIGTISMDCPFLGLHPGIVVSGITSLFRPADEPPTPAQGDSSSTMLSPVTTGTSASEYSQLNRFDSNSSFQPTDSSLALSPSTPSLVSEQSTSNNDPFFNAPFFNDAAFKERPFKQRLKHFVQKHSSEGIFGAAKNHVLSHLEYGACLADYPALHSRYNRVRALEDVDELQALRQQHNGQGYSGTSALARVRFVNYYTISTGRPKKEKPATPPREERQGSPSRSSLEKEQLTAPNADGLDPRSRASTPTIQVEPPGGGEKQELLSPHEIPETATSKDEQAQIPSDHKPASSTDEGRILDTGSTDELRGYQLEASQTDLSKLSSVSQDTVDLPAIPDAPEKPTPPDLTRYPDEDSRRQAEKEAKRELKAYEQAVKNRDKALKERQKLLEKRRKKSEKDQAKQEKEAEKQRLKEEKEKEKQRLKEEKGKEQEKRNKSPETPAEQNQQNDGPSNSPPPVVQDAYFDTPTTPGDIVPDHEAPMLRSISPMPESDTELPVEGAAKPTPAAKPLKERKFCVLPRRPDPTWVRVFMQDVDEVGAHCGLFIAEAPHYDGLIGDFGQRIVEWVQEDMTKKAILKLAEETDDLALD